MDQAGEAAFADYFRARREVVRRNAYLLCGDWHRADDLAQTAFVALHRKWDSIRDPGAVDAYLRRILVRAMIDETRRPWRRERAVPETPEPIHQGRSDGTAEQVTTRHTLTQALDRLPPRQRAVLVLRFLEGLDVAATAKALGCRQGTVKSQTSHGLATLRTVLGGESAWINAS
ncbi:SigE family RNA polymerase sigma factor [Pseudonocardia spinosispora]|uniref:SigE family RNA polymerase sigma factor n=1 Tax=Pseudonocardia spinosispora TaxID=103441 RepID=UPI000420FFC1|nr:SigE family RNA polymerase sigma factor [Pseudonocardia spinosispora]